MNRVFALLVGAGLGFVGVCGCFGVASNNFLKWLYLVTGALIVLHEMGPSLFRPRGFSVVLCLLSAAIAIAGVLGPSTLPEKFVHVFAGMLGAITVVGLAIIPGRQLTTWESTMEADKVLSREYKTVKVSPGLVSILTVEILGLLVLIAFVLVQYAIQLR